MTVEDKFQEYVSKYANKHNLTIEEAVKHKIVCYYGQSIGRLVQEEVEHDKVRR